MNGERRRGRAAVRDETDGQLVERARDGCGDAFAQLYVRHARAVQRALTDNVHDRERRRDLVQETFTRALTKLATLRDTSQFRPWVLQIARNAAIDDLRSRTMVRLESIGEDHRSLAAVEHGPETMAEAHELATVVRAGVATLSPRDAAAVSMVAHLGFGPDEVADALGITPGNASVVLHRARARLRRAMATGDESIDEACGSVHERQHLSA